MWFCGPVNFIKINKSKSMIVKVGIGGNNFNCALSEVRNDV
jgi:hypothetical protein